MDPRQLAQYTTALRCELALKPASSSVVSVVDQDAALLCLEAFRKDASAFLAWLDKGQLPPGPCHEVCPTDEKVDPASLIKSATKLRKLCNASNKSSRPQISMAAFNEIVSENETEFDMTPAEAKMDAIAGLLKQGVDLSNLAKMSAVQKQMAAEAERAVETTAAGSEGDCGGGGATKEGIGSYNRVRVLLVTLADSLRRLGSSASAFIQSVAAAAGLPLSQLAERRKAGALVAMLWEQLEGAVSHTKLAFGGLLLSPSSSALLSAAGSGVQDRALDVSNALKLLAGALPRDSMKAVREFAQNVWVSSCNVSEVLRCLSPLLLERATRLQLKETVAACVENVSKLDEFVRKCTIGHEGVAARAAAATASAEQLLMALRILGLCVQALAPVRVPGVAGEDGLTASIRVALARGMCLTNAATNVAAALGLHKSAKVVCDVEALAAAVGVSTQCNKKMAAALVQRLSLSEPPPLNGHACGTDAATEDEDVSASLSALKVSSPSSLAVNTLASEVAATYRSLVLCLASVLPTVSQLGDTSNLTGQMRLIERDLAPLLQLVSSADKTGAAASPR